MSSKDEILKKLSADGMPEYPYPASDFTPQRFDDPAATFAERLGAAGGRAVRMAPDETLDDVVRRCYPDARTIASAMPSWASPRSIPTPWRTRANWSMSTWAS